MAETEAKILSKEHWLSGVAAPGPFLFGWDSEISSWRNGVFSGSLRALGAMEFDMKLAITALAFAVYTVGVSAVYAGGCHSSCADGYTYSKDAGKCVKKEVSS